MKVKDLIELLEKENPKADVFLHEFTNNYKSIYYTMPRACNHEYQEEHNMILFYQGTRLPEVVLNMRKIER